MMCIPFFMAQWEEHHTGVLRTCVLWNEGKRGWGVTETQWLQMSMFLLAATVGAWVFYVPLFMGVTLMTAIVNGFTLSLIPVCGLSFKMIWETKQTNDRRLAAFSELASPMFISFLAATWPEASLLLKPRVISMTYGIAMILCITKMIIFSMAHMEYKPFQPVILCVLVPYMVESYTSGSGLIVNASFVSAFFLYFRFVCGAITEISDHPGIRCFTIKEKKEAPALSMGKKDEKKDQDQAKSPTGTNC